jgi:hypothetical protein
MHPVRPAAPLRDATVRVFRGFFARVGKACMGTRLYQIFLNSGLTRLPRSTIR